MTSVELFKIRVQRTPLVCALALLIGSLIPSAVMIWYTPASAGSYSTTFEITFGILSVLLGIVFGGWLLGGEYRQGTVKRMLTAEPRRVRALVVKAAVGLTAMAGVLTVVAGVGWTAARLVGSMNDVVVAWDGRTLLASGLTAMFSALIAYGLSAITRSDAFAMVATVATLLVLDPLLGLVPKVGTYSLGGALDRIETAVSGTSELAANSLSLGGAGLTLSAWIGTVLIGGAMLFRSRDV